MNYLRKNHPKVLLRAKLMMSDDLLIGHRDLKYIDEIIHCSNYRLHHPLTVW